MIVQNVQKENDYFNEGKMFSTLFNKEIKVTFEKEVQLEYVERCAKHFNELSEELKNKIYERVSAYHQFMLEEWNEEFVEEINEKVPKDIKGKGILEYVTQPNFIVFEPKDESSLGYTIEGLCEWEPEHGIDIILRDDKLLYVGPSECLGSWADDDEYEVEF